MMFERWFKNLFTESKESAQPVGPVDIIPITREITYAELKKADILEDGRMVIASSSEIDFFDLPLERGKNKGIRIKPRQFTYYLPSTRISCLPLQGTLLTQGDGENLILLHRDANHTDPKGGYSLLCSLPRAKELAHQLGNTLIVYDPFTLLRLLQASGELSIVPCSLQNYSVPYSVVRDVPPNAKMIALKNRDIAVLNETSLQCWTLRDARYQLEKSIPLEFKVNPTQSFFIQTPQENLALVTALSTLTYKRDWTFSKSLEHNTPLFNFQHVPNTSFIIARDRENTIYILDADKMELYPQDIKANFFRALSKECIAIAGTYFRIEESLPVSALDRHLPRDPAGIVVAYLGLRLVEIPQPSFFKDDALKFKKT
ncbi:MAG: hypothetical protein ACYCQI_10945 [Gammaproteobacteria bacterium]